MRDRDYDHGSRITSHISSEIRFCIRIMSLSSLGTGNEHQKLIDRYGHRYARHHAGRAHIRAHSFLIRVWTVIIIIHHHHCCHRKPIIIAMLCPCPCHVSHLFDAEHFIAPARGLGGSVTRLRKSKRRRKTSPRREQPISF